MNTKLRPSRRVFIIAGCGFAVTLALLVAALLFVHSWMSVDEQAFEAVTVGMTTDEVTEMMGEPNLRGVTLNGGESWTYHDRMPMLMVPDPLYSIRFQDSKVVDKEKSRF